MDNPRHYKPGKRPISCRFCRTRKLRCSREAPCSNCLERRLACDLQPPKARPRDETRSELLERIARLETLLGKSPEPRPSLHSDVPGREASSTLQEPALLSSYPQSGTAPDTSSLDDEVAHLERIYVDKDTSLINITQPRIGFKVCRMQDIINGSALDTFVDAGTKTICLPEYLEAKMCLQKFTDDLEHIHHVCHIPTLGTTIDEIYLSLNSHTQTKPGHVLLLLGILVSSIHSWSHHDHKRGGMFATREEASRQVPLFLRYLEDVLDISHRNSVISIEGVQGLIIASFVLCNYEGFSRRSRSWYSTCLLLARELGLHQIDRPGSKKSMTHREAEIGRRVWWYIASSDWMIAARFNGIAQGVYSCHIRQMMTRKPLHINDEDLCDDHVPVEKPMSQPTMMSYYLHRLKLTEIARAHLDLLPLVKTDNDSSAYDLILTIDSDIQTLLNELPVFFSMAPTEIMTRYNLSPLRAGHIHHNGYMIRQIVNAQRCSMHIPYLSRSYHDNTYATSRIICLTAAKAVIATETAIEDNATSLTDGACCELMTAARYKFLGLLMVVFMSSVILMVDQCQLKRPGRSPELQAAINLLERARNETQTAARFLAQLMNVLQRHKLPSAAPPQQASTLPVSAGTLDNPPASKTKLSGPHLFPSTDAVLTPLTTYSGATSGSPHTTNLDPPLPTHPETFVMQKMNMTTFFDDFADNMQSGLGFDTGDFGGMDWPEMFLELDGHMG